MCRPMVYLFIASLLFVPLNASAVNLTLNDAGLMALDWQDPGRGGMVTARRDVAGPGVEIDIRFPSNQSPDSSIVLASTRFGGAGLLAGLDLSPFENFALTCTMVALDGDPITAAGGALVVGAIVYDSANIYRYRPEVIDMGQYHGRTKTSVTNIVASARQDGLGIHAHMFVPDKWSPTGNTVTLLVQPAAGAVQIPEPFSAILLALGGLALLRRTYSR